ncbi:MAG: hypothetical protein ACK58N_05860 [Synechocystis sp.]
MQGIQYIVDDQGEKTAVVIDLSQWGQEWQAFYSALAEKSSDSQTFVDQPQLREKLEKALVWSSNHPAQAYYLDSLEKQLSINE